MSELNYNPLIFVVVGIGALLAALWAVRWWRERKYDLSGKTVLITVAHVDSVSSWRASWRAQEHVWQSAP